MTQQLLQLAFFGSFAWFLVASVFLLVCFIWSELDEHGGIAFVAVLGFLIVNHFFGNVPTKEIFTWWNVVGYLFLGLVYALVRTYHFGKTVSSIYIKSNEKNSPVPSELKENVFRWWFLWPISLIVWVCSELLGDLYDKLYDFCSSLFNYMFNLGLKTNKKVTKEK